MHSDHCDCAARGRRTSECGETTAPQFLNEIWMLQCRHVSVRGIIGLLAVSKGDAVGLLAICREFAISLLAVSQRR